MQIDGLGPALRFRTIMLYAFCAYLSQSVAG